GAIINAYTQFENDLFCLCVHYWDARKIPRNETEPFYFEIAEDKRIAFLKLTCALCETDQRVKDRINNLAEYFSICKQQRDWLTHARKEYLVSTPKPKTTYLVKRSRKKTNLQYLTLTTTQLRSIATSMRRGSTTCCALLN